MNWQDVLQNVHNKNKSYDVERVYCHGNVRSRNGEKRARMHAITKPPVKKRKKYPIGSHYPGVYLAQREAECIYWLLKTNRYKKVSDKMNISLRTVETYIKNIRTKLHCNKKAEIISIIQKSNFMQHYQSHDLAEVEPV